MSPLNRCIILGKQVGFHQVCPGQELVSRVDAVEVLARDIQKHGQACTGAHEDGIIAVLKDFVYGHGLTNHEVQFNVHSQRLYVVNLGLNDIFGQAKLGDAIHQHTTRDV